MWVVYDLLVLLGLLLYLPCAVWRRRLPHAGWSMRLGRYPSSVTAAVEGRSSLWIHAVSVGEVLAARPLIRALAQRDPDTPLVLSTITAGGLHVARQQPNVIPVLFPLDVSRCVHRAFEVVRPRALLLMESELWPNVIRVAHASHVPIAVVNGRMSERAFRRYQRIRPLATPLLLQIERFLMQTDIDARRVQQLGVPAQRIQVVGSLKWDASLGARPTPELIQQAADALGLHGEPVIVAGSTHRGEEQSVLQAFRAIRRAQPTVRLIIAPRHLERLDEVQGLAQQSGFVVRRVSHTDPAGSWDIALVDTFGRLPIYYGLGRVAFIGGSLIPHGGQNPLEAASLNVPTVFGPSMENFADITQQLIDHQAACQISHPGELSQQLQAVLGDPNLAQALGQRAQQLIARQQGATSRLLSKLEPILNK